MDDLKKTDGDQFLETLHAAARPLFLANLAVLMPMALMTSAVLSMGMPVLVTGIFLLCSLVVAAGAAYVATFGMCAALWLLRTFAEAY